VGLFINGGVFSKASAPPLFLEDENIFQKSAPESIVWIGHLREKGGGADFFPGFVWWVVLVESPIQI
jgi:hypothetical protein